MEYTLNVGGLVAPGEALNIPDRSVLEEVVSPTTRAMTMTGSGDTDYTQETAHPLPALLDTIDSPGPTQDVGLTIMSRLESVSSLDIVLPNVMDRTPPRPRRCISDMDLTQISSSTKSNSLASMYNSLDSLNRINPDSPFNSKHTFDLLSEINRISPSSLSIDSDLPTKPQQKPCFEVEYDECINPATVSITKPPRKSSIFQDSEIPKPPRHPHTLHRSHDSVHPPSYYESSTLQPLDLSIPKSTGAEIVQESCTPSTSMNALSGQSKHATFQFHTKTSTQSSETRYTKKLLRFRAAPPNACQSVASSVEQTKVSDIAFPLVTTENGDSPSTPPIDLMSVDLSNSNDSVKDDFTNQPPSVASKLDSFCDTIIRSVDAKTVKDVEFQQQHHHLQDVEEGVSFRSDITFGGVSARTKDSELFKRAVKAELKCKIQIRQEFGDLTPGVSSERTQSSTSSNIPLSPTKELELKRKQKNREHARNSRERANKERQDLAQQNQFLERSVQALETENKSLENKYKSVESWLSSHFSCEQNKAVLVASSKTTTSTTTSTAVAAAAASSVGTLNTQSTHDEKSLHSKKTETKSVSILPFSVSRPGSSASSKRRSDNGKSIDDPVEGDGCGESELDNVLHMKQTVKGTPSPNNYESIWSFDRVPSTWSTEVDHSPNVIGHSPKVVSHNREIVSHSRKVVSYSHKVVGNSLKVVGHGPEEVGHSPKVVGHSPKVVGHSPEVVFHSPKVVGHSPKAVGHSPKIVGHSPEVVGHSPNVVGVGHSHKVADHSPKVVGHSPTVKHESRADSDTLQSKIRVPLWILDQEDPTLNIEDIEHVSPWEVGGRRHERRNDKEHPAPQTLIIPTHAPPAMEYLEYFRVHQTDHPFLSQPVSPSSEYKGVKTVLWSDTGRTSSTSISHPSSQSQIKQRIKVTLQKQTKEQKNTKVALQNTQPYPSQKSATVFSKIPGGNTNFFRPTESSLFTTNPHHNAIQHESDALSVNDQPHRPPLGKQSISLGLKKSQSAPKRLSHSIFRHTTPPGLDSRPELHQLPHGHRQDLKTSLKSREYNAKTKTITPPESKSPQRQSSPVISFPFDPQRNPKIKSSSLKHDSPTLTFQNETPAFTPAAKKRPFSLHPHTTVSLTRPGAPNLQSQQDQELQLQRPLLKIIIPTTSTTTTTTKMDDDHVVIDMMSPVSLSPNSPPFVLPLPTAPHYINVPSHPTPIPRSPLSPQSLSSLSIVSPQSICSPREHNSPSSNHSSLSPDYHTHYNYPWLP